MKQKHRFYLFIFYLDGGLGCDQANKEANVNIYIGVQNDLISSEGYN